MLTPEERKQLDTLMGQVAKINYVLHNYGIIADARIIKDIKI